MSLFSTLGTIGGAILGNAVVPGLGGILGGAALGGSVGSGIDQYNAAGEARALDAETLAEIERILTAGRDAETAAIEEGNAEAAAAIREAVASQLAVFDTLINDVHPERMAALRGWFGVASAPFEPYTAAGTNALAQQQAMLGLSGTFDPNLITSLPSYQFVLDEGLKAVDRSASARSGSLSGRAVKEAERYGAGLASQEFQNEFARLGTLSSLGMDAAKGVSTAATYTQDAVNKAYSDLYNVYAGQAGVYGAEGTALANLALSNASSLVGVSQNYTSGLLGLAGADLQSQQNQLSTQTNAFNNALNSLTTLGTLTMLPSLYGAKPTITSGGGTDPNYYANSLLNTPSATPSTAITYPISGAGSLPGIPLETSMTWKALGN